MKKLMVALAAVLAAGFSLTTLAANTSNRPEDAVDLTSPNGNVVASENLLNNMDAKLAFNDATALNDSSKRFITNNKKSATIVYTFDTAENVNAIGIQNFDNGDCVTRSPKSWKFWGSDDFDGTREGIATATWEQIESATQTSETGWKRTEYRFYQFENRKKYKSYKIDFTEVNGNTYLQFQKMEYFSYYPTAVEVTGAPGEFGDIEYGVKTTAPGSDVELTAFDGEWQNAEGTVRASCTGFEYYEQDASSGEMTLKDSGKATSYSFTMPEVNVRVVWQFEGSLTVAAAAENGTVDGTGEYAMGSEVTLKAVPNEGYSFVCWSGLPPDADPLQSTVSFAANEPVAAKAYFLPEGVAARFVATTGKDTNGGLSPDTPFATIAKAIDDLDKGTIYVAPGTYAEDLPSGAVSIFALGKPIGIVGTGDSQADVIIKRKSGDCRVIELNHADAFVRNVTISGGYSNANKGAANGGNVSIGANGGTVEDCIIADGTVKTFNSAGGNLWAQAGRVSRCVIRNGNCSSGNGAKGGGALFAEGTAVVENCLIVGNKVGYANNGPTASAGVRVSGSAKVINCTIVDNGDASAVYGGCYADGSSQIVNCAIFGNLARPDETHPGNACFGGTASCYVNCAGEAAPNDTCIACDVKTAAFVEFDRADYTPSVASPLRDAGFDYELTGAGSKTDLAGKNRIFNNRVDIGAYEFEMQGIGGDFIVLGENVGFMPFTASFKATVDGAQGEVTYRWDFDGDGETDLTTTEATVEWTYSDFETAGKYTVRLNVAADGSELDVEHADVITALPKELYVVPENPNARYPYATRETAATNINDAVDAAILDGITIFVADGTYRQKQPIRISRGISLLGESGIAANAIVKNVTGYSGDTTANNLQVDSPDAFVAGLTFTDSKIRNRGSVGAVTVHGGTVSNCVISSAEGQCSYYTQCAGLYMNGGLVTHCVIRDNVVDKKSTQGGETPGAMVAGGSLENSLVTGNTRGNEAEGVCRAVSVSGSGRVVNCDILRNALGCTVEGGARAVEVGNGATLQNCVVFGNRAKDDETMGVVTGATANVVASLSEDDGLTAAAFKKYEQGDYTPKSGGALTDKGVTPEGWKGITDLAGKPRVIGKAVDIGCYEGNSAGLILNVK